jgi:hypothetical protein
MPTIPNKKRSWKHCQADLLGGGVATSLKVVAEHHFILQDLRLLLHLDSTETSTISRILYVKIRQSFVFFLVTTNPGAHNSGRHPPNSISSAAQYFSQAILGSYITVQQVELFRDRWNIIKREGLQNQANCTYCMNIISCQAHRIAHTNLPI